MRSGREALGDCHTCAQIRAREHNHAKNVVLPPLLPSTPLLPHERLRLEQIRGRTRSMCTVNDASTSIAIFHVQLPRKNFTLYEYFSFPSAGASSDVRKYHSNLQIRTMYTPWNERRRMYIFTRGWLDILYHLPLCYEICCNSGSEKMANTID